MQVNNIYEENDTSQFRTKNIINQNFLDITIFEKVYGILTQLGVTLFHPLLYKYENYSFNQEVYTRLEKFKAHLSKEFTITLVTAAFSVQVNIYEMNKSSLSRAALLLQKKSNIRAN